MKLSTILTLPGASVAEKVERIRELVNANVAALLPNRLRYAVLISCGVKAIGNDDIVPEVRYMDVLQRTPAA
ncbi:hypothetical protein [Arthrobacter pityocampae]|uniref:hypothetical protein n=1 Tax=Arthrobacter pityocampae TaxID=547334 RepID=UPI003736D692